MARSATDRPDDPDIMALIPPAPLKMKGRFAPFSSPDQIVAGTWRTPRDWPEARKDEAVKELRMRRSDIVRLPNEPDPDRLVIQECSRLLNGMYGDPTRWPRRAVDVALGYPCGTRPGSKYNDPGLWGITLPPEFSAAVVGFGSALKGKALGYRDAVYALYEKAKLDGLFIDRIGRNTSASFPVRTRLGLSGNYPKATPLPYRLPPASVDSVIVSLNWEMSGSILNPPTGIEISLEVLNSLTDP